jgi:hypothetical protein
MHSRSQPRHTKISYTRDEEFQEVNKTTHIKSKVLQNLALRVRSYLHHPAHPALHITHVPTRTPSSLSKLARHHRPKVRPPPANNQQRTNSSASTSSAHAHTRTKHNPSAQSQHPPQCPSSAWAAARKSPRNRKSHRRRRRLIWCRICTVGMLFLVLLSDYRVRNMRTSYA